MLKRKTVLPSVKETCLEATHINLASQFIMSPCNKRTLSLSHLWVPLAITIMDTYYIAVITYFHF